MSKSQPPLVSFVVLNWNGLTDTLECLDSIRKQTITNYEIIVVDNGSAAEQKDTLRNIPDIKLIDLPKNTGFTGGQIAGYQKSRGKYLALINNDAVIDPDWAKLGVETFKHQPSAGAVGSKIYSWDNKQPAFSQKNSYLSYWTVNLRTGHTRPIIYDGPETIVDSVSGSGVMISRKVIEKLGYFDDTFFAYYEESDLFARYKRAGYEIIYNPTMQIWHKAGQSTRSVPDFYLYHMHRNRCMFAVKNYDRPFLYAFLFFYAKEWFHAAGVVLKYGAEKHREEINLIKAGVWNAIHFVPLLFKRAIVQKLGPTYSQTLLKDTAERISVIIPCYNYETFVQEAIESVLSQSRPPDEIIVINDGSTDTSLAKIRAYQDRVHIIDQKNQGTVKTKNIGLQQATTDWVVYLDADDTMDHEFLKKMYANARRTNADVIYSAMHLTGDEDDIFWSRPFSRRSLRKGNYINNSSLIRRNFLQNIGGYSSEMSFGYEDWELYVHLAEIGAKFHFIREPLLLYRRHSANSRDKVAQTKLDKAHFTIRKLHPQIFSKKYEFIDFLYSIPLFFRYRTPLQIIKDVRYAIITRLDKVSEHSRILNKLLGFCRLLTSGEFNKIFTKLVLNVERLWKRSAK